MNILPLETSAEVPATASLTASVRTVESSENPLAQDRVTLSAEGLSMASSASENKVVWSGKVVVPLDDDLMKNMAEHAGERAMTFFTESMGNLFQNMDDAKALGLTQQQFDKFKDDLAYAIDQQDYKKAEKIIARNVSMDNAWFRKQVTTVTDRTVEAFGHALAEEFAPIVYLYKYEDGGNIKDTVGGNEKGDREPTLDTSDRAESIASRLDQATTVESGGDGGTEGGESGGGVDGTEAGNGGGTESANSSDEPPRQHLKATKEVAATIHKVMDIFEKELEEKINGEHFFTALGNAVADLAKGKLLHANRNKYTETTETILGCLTDFSMGAVMGNLGLDAYAEVKGIEINRDMRRGANKLTLDVESMVKKAVRPFVGELRRQTGYEDLGAELFMTVTGDKRHRKIRYGQSWGELTYLEKHLNRINERTEAQAAEFNKRIQLMERGDWESNKNGIRDSYLDSLMTGTWPEDSVE